MTSTQSIVDTIGSLSLKQQNEVFETLRKLHGNDPFHLIRECSLCCDVELKEAGNYFCEGCRICLPHGWDTTAICVRCKHEFGLCEDESRTCARKIMLMWDCECESGQASHDGICNRCARDEPSLIKCQINDPHYQCTAVMENPYAAPITKRAG